MTEAETTQIIMSLLQKQATHDANITQCKRDLDGVAEINRGCVREINERFIWIDEKIDVNQESLKADLLAIKTELSSTKESLEIYRTSGRLLSSVLLGLILFLGWLVSNAENIRGLLK